MKKLTIEEIQKEIGSFAAILLLDASFAGSGTFVSCDDTYGILTALHVIRRNHFDFSSGSSQRLGLIIDSRLHCLELELKYLKLIEVGKPPDRKFGPFGPDIAFIKIPNMDKLGTIRAKKSFFNISYKKDEKLKLSLKDEGVWVVSCCAQELVVKKGPQEGFKKILEFEPITGFTVVDNRSEIDNFDYVEVGLSSTNCPSTFEGASGGGLWRVPLEKGKDATMEDVKYENPILSGVIFYQTSKIGNRRILRCHGGKTIYRNLYEKIKNCK